MPEPKRDPFRARFLRAPTVVARAAGRVNLIGEHTDYNGGYVLPTAIPQHTEVAMAPRNDREVRAASAAFSGGLFCYRLGDEKRRGAWTDYVAGVTRVLAEEGFFVGGCDLLVSSAVPVGAGLSSSAALDVALLRGFRELYGLALDDLRLALLAQAVETRFVGAPVGVMDPLACSLASPGVAIFVDTRALTVERVAIPPSLELVVIDSGLAHSHATGDYRARRAECEEAARRLGVSLLRDVDENMLDRVARLPAPLDRRARHVVTEDARVLAAVAALRAGDLPALGALLDASHASLRDDFEVSLPPIDRLVAIAQRQPNVFGARITGGGFGGAIVALCPEGQGRAVGGAVVRAFRDEAAGAARLLVPA